MKVAFFDCITGQGFFSDLANRALFLEGISDRLGNRRYRVIRKEGALCYLQDRGAESVSLLATCLKIVLIATLVLPLIFILIKRYSRYHQYILEQESDPPFLPEKAKPILEPPLNRVPPLNEFILPLAKPFVPRPTKAWPVAKPISQPTPVEEESLTLSLKDSQGREKRVDPILACTASPVLAAACHGQMTEATQKCFHSLFLDNKVLDIVTTTIQEKKMPPLEFDSLVNFYRATDQLQMKNFAECRQKLIQRVRFDFQLTEEQLQNVYLLAEEHQDVALQVFCMERFEVPCEKMRSHFNSLKKGPFKLDLDESGNVSLTLSTLDSERIQAVQELAIQQLTVTSLFDPSLVQEMGPIKSLTIADQNQFQIKTELVSALLKSDLETLKLCYCNLDEKATEALAEGLQENRKLTSLILKAVGLHEKSLAKIVEALRNNRSLTFLHVSHHEFDTTCLQEALKEKQNLKTVCLSKSVLV